MKAPPPRIDEPESVPAVAGVLGWVGLATLLLAGCTGIPTLGERQARQDLAAVGDVYRPQHQRPTLPLLSATSGLDEFLQFSILNQPQVEAAYYDWSAAVQRITVERSLPDPRLTFSADIASMVKSLMPGLMMDFPGPGKRGAAANVATAESEARYFAFESSVLRAAFVFKKAYHELHFLEGKLRVNRETLRLVNEVEKLARAQNEVGKVTLHDVLRAQIEQERLTTEIANLDDSRNPLIAQFKAALGLKAEDAAPPVPQTFESTPPDLNSEKLLATALTRNPRLKAMESEVRQADASLRLAYKARVPDFSLGIEADVKASPIMVSPQIGVTLPIWRDKTAAQIAGAQAGKQAAEARLSDEEIALAVELAEKSFLFREASRSLELLTARLLPKARQSLEVAQSGYVSAKVDFLNLLDAERTLLDFQLAEVDARLQRELALAELSLLILGTPPVHAPLLSPGAAGEKGETMNRIFTKKLFLVALAVVVVGGGALLCLSRSADEPGDGENVAAASGQTWTCSMHPQVRLPNPGKCPICSMPLIRAGGPASAKAPGETAGSMLELSEHARAMASVETSPVRRRKLTREIRVVGKVQYNETALASITTRVEGYVERLFVDYTGIEVKAGDHLVEIYSPDLLVAQQELLIALAGQGNSGLVESAQRKLLLWGLTQAQVDALVRDKKVSDRITLFSPIAGTVTEKMVVQKAMVKPGEVLYRLANLESVWVYLDLYESELPWVHYGQMVEIKSEAIPGQTFSGRVWFMSPVLTEDTRTVKVLLNINNAAHTLKPGMYVSAVIRAELLASGKAAPTGVEGQWSCPMHPLVLQPQAGPCPVCKMPLVQIPGTPAGAKPEDDPLPLSVPMTAVLDSGVRKLVYVERSKGQFIPVEIVTGPRTDDSYPVLSGLNEGDVVVTRGNFLLDSQFQIRGLPSLFYKEGQAAAAGHQHGGAAPPAARPGAGPVPPETVPPASAPPATAPKAPGHDQHKP